MPGDTDQYRSAEQWLSFILYPGFMSPRAAVFNEYITYRVSIYLKKSKYVQAIVAKVCACGEVINEEV